MQKKSMLKSVVLSIAFIVLLCGCGKPKDSIEIGFSACESETSRSIALIQDITAAAQKENRSLELRCADGKLSKQKEDIQELLKLNPQYLLVIPTKTLGLERILQEATNAGVQVIILDRNMEKSEYTNYLTQISTDAYAEGALCAQVLADYFNGSEGAILEIQGQAGSSLTNDRARGFREKLCEYSNMEIVKVIEGNFNRVEAERNSKEFMNKGGEFNAVFGHSDEEGLGMLSALDNQNTKNPIPIVSVNGQQEIKQALIAGNYLATAAADPYIGTEVMKVIRDHESGVTIEKSIIMPSYLYTQNNAPEMQEY